MLKWGDTGCTNFGNTFDSMSILIQTRVFGRGKSGISTSACSFNIS